MSALGLHRFPQRTRWGAVAMLMGFAFLGHFNRVGMSVVGKERLIGAEGLSEEQMGLVYSAFLLIYTLCMLPGGWFIDRIGPAAALRWMGLSFGVCAILTGVLGWFALAPLQLWLALIIVRGIAGAGSTPLHPGAARGVALWSAADTRSSANGLVTAGALIGIALTYPGFGWLIDQFDWPGACLAGGALLMGWALLWGAVAPRAADPRSRPRVDNARTAGAEVSSQHTPPGAGLLLRNPSLLLLTASYAAVGYFQYLFFYWMQFYFDHTLKLPGSASRRASFVVTMAMAVGMAVGGWFADAACRRCGSRWGRRLTAFCGMGLSALFAVLGVNSTEPQTVVTLFSLALGSLGLCEGIFWTASTELGGRIGGFASAILNTGGNAGGMLAPALTPWLATRYGWGAAIGVACAICAVGGSMWLGIQPAASDEADE